jgi:hypothetical protein
MSSPNTATNDTMTMTTDEVLLKNAEIQKKTYDIIRVFLPGCLICQCTLIVFALVVFYVQYKRG